MPTSLPLKGMQAAGAGARRVSADLDRTQPDRPRFIGIRASAPSPPLTARSTGTGNGGSKGDALAASQRCAPIEPLGAT